MCGGSDHRSASQLQDTSWLPGEVRSWVRGFRLISKTLLLPLTVTDFATYLLIVNGFQGPGSGKRYVRPYSDVARLQRSKSLKYLIKSQSVKRLFDKF